MTSFQHRACHYDWLVRGTQDREASDKNTLREGSMLLWTSTVHTTWVSIVIACSRSLGEFFKIPRSLDRFNSVSDPSLSFKYITMPALMSKLFHMVTKTMIHLTTEARESSIVCPPIYPPLGS